MKSIPQLPAGFTPHWNGPYELTVHVQNVKAPHSRDYVTGWDSTKIGPDGRISHGGSNMYRNPKPEPHGDDRAAWQDWASTRTGATDHQRRAIFEHIRRYLDALKDTPAPYSKRDDGQPMTALELLQSLAYDEELDRQADADEKHAEELRQEAQRLDAAAKQKRAAKGTYQPRGPIVNPYSESHRARIFDDQRR